MQKFFILLSTILLMTTFVACGGGSGGSDDSPPPSDEDTYEDHTVPSDDEQLKLDGTSPAPPVLIDPEQPASGQQATVTVVWEEATAITVSLEGSGCGALTGGTGTDAVTLSGAVGDFGTCSITATITLPDATTVTQMGYFEVDETDPDLPIISVIDAAYLAKEMPDSSTSSDRPEITSIDGPGTLINGGTYEYTLAYTSPTGEPVVAVLVEIPGYAGHFRLPVTDNGDGTITFYLDVANNAFETGIQSQARSLQTVMADGPAISLGVIVEDLLGFFSDLFFMDLTGQEVGTGDVKLSISWSGATDVDLRVVEPSGEEIYYGDKTSATGGQLDLDSNAGCSIDNINNENIYWPEGQSPAGEYNVRVNLWSGCDVGSASGTLTITYCGDDSPLVLPFTVSTGSPNFTYTFNSVCTTQASVSGTVKYEDFAVTSTGLSASGIMLPVRLAKIQAVRASDGAVLADGFTKADGTYTLSFENDGPAGYYVEVLASQDMATLNQEVKDLSGNLYKFRMPATGSIDETQTPDNTGHDFAVRKADGAGALNIFDMGLKFSQYARLNGGKNPSKLTWRWTAGQKPLGKASSFFSSSTQQIYVLGMASDPDEYDDVILGHEYGHFVMYDYSTSNSPGGSHSSNDQEVPTLSWSEGWATFFACAALGRSTYADTNATGMGAYYSIESLPASKPLGNAGGAIDGNLSEAVVAAVLLDLFDTANETKDTLKGKSTAIWSVLTTYLKSGHAKFNDRGVTGRDLVDFLDGWFCLGYDDKGEDDTEGVRGNVKGIHELSYDFADLSSCK